MSRPLAAAPAAVALAAALLAAAALPGNRLGLAATAVTWGLIAAAVAAGRGTPIFIVPAGLLALAPFVRDATWVVAPDLVAAVVLTTVAVAQAADWHAMAKAVGRMLSGLLPGLPALLVPLAAGLERERLRAAVPVIRGVALGGVLLAVFGALFVSADAAFAEVVDETVVPDWTLGRLPERGLVFALAASLAGALALTATQPQPVTAARVVTRRLQPAEWMPALVLLDLLFAAFVAVQLTVLFGGHDHVLSTTGLTYAQYARHGFVELIIAAALTLAVTAVAARHAARDDSRMRRALLVLTGILFALTLVVLASALRRLGLYEDAFGFTRARLLAHGIILWLGALFVLVAGCVALRHGRAIARSSVLLTAVGLLAAAIANPDGLIAERNVERLAVTGRVDAVYLADLSADALPRLAQLPPSIRACVLASQAARLSGGDGLAEANLARSRARRTLATLPRAGCKR